MPQNQRTRVVAAGRPHEPNSPVNPPVDFTSTYMYRPSVAYPQVYAREGIPSFEPLEQLLAELEAGAHGLLFSSGQAAISAVISQLPLGGHLIIPKHAYMGYYTLAAQLAAKGHFSLHRVDITETEQVLSTVREAAQLAAAQNTQALLWIESPTNPMLEVADVPALIAGARQLGVRTAVDNTFATPLRQNPLKHGADVVIHSVTKFISGHSDVIMGAAVTADPALHTALHAHRNLHGTIPGPMEVFLALRGVRTLAVRLDAAERNAEILARRLDELSKDDAVPLTRVTYPGLDSHPQHERAKAQFGGEDGGFGAIITIDTGSLEAADAVLESLQVWTPATSLGGVESLAERRRRHPGEPETVPEGLIRLSVGIEAAEDLYQDLAQALRAAA
ncbi:trans-sulfuration enzyme family protein [Nesterenkonia alkaliphila]|uniref:homocysteine desulfhydrase n=1 Tax=Nesterenkonia alkaliphila TaxID=1463631 RepID=A0A7K1UH19_9MICC|nr:PLP-dependent aspartate aminotransferase family protein [Nesterenkonia alkaliphila]MVT25770.1 cystathionine gamma-synthase [Nesterenkonia alkaliphila]GFZ93152.1 cystathionine gamma-synthase [Nesterenkonia alkaliphila]